MTETDELTLLAIDSVRLALPRIERAITTRDSESSNAGFVSGGMPSWEPIKLSALSWRQDVRREVDEIEQELRLALGMRWHRARDLDVALGQLAIAVDAAARSAESVPELDDARRRVESWAHRAALVLRDLRAPYALLWPDGTRVLCPVVIWTGTQSEGFARACPGQLWVHRDPDSGTPSSIVCRVRRDHEWQSGPGWLRLGVLLGGIV